ncbi:mastin-like isoform X2 [Tamandua tetradactyla]
MLWLLLLALPCLGGSTPVTPDPILGHELVGIVGGCDVSSRKYPWQVSLRFFNKRLQLWEHWCGGSLVHPQWVLTSAHCMEPEDLEGCAYRVQVGQLRLYEHDRLARVAQVIRHPKFNVSKCVLGGADIALLKLEVPVQLSEVVSPIDLAPTFLRIPKGKTCWVAGWGDVEPGEPLPRPYHLQEVEVQVLGNAHCSHLYHHTAQCNSSGPLITDDVLCAGTHDQGPCHHDSGGPLVYLWNCTWVQVGIVSWDRHCGRRDLPGVYTRVSSYVTWIHQQIAQGSGL